MARGIMGSSARHRARARSVAWGKERDIFKEGR